MVWSHVQHKMAKFTTDFFTGEASFPSNISSCDEQIEELSSSESLGPGDSDG